MNIEQLLEKCADLISELANTVSELKTLRIESEYPFVGPDNEPRMSTPVMSTFFRDAAGNLKNGVYRVHWTNGSFSVCAVGSFSDGTKWFSPANWVSRDLSPIQESIDLIDRFELIEPVNYEWSYKEVLLK